MSLSTFFSHWDQVREALLHTIDLFNETELTFTPFSGSWSAGRIMLHIADAEEGWFGVIATKELEEWPTGYVPENYPTKEAIKTLLTSTHEKTKSYLDSLEFEDLNRVVESPWGCFSLRFIIWHVIDHEIHHRGELSLILGILGKEGLDV